MVGIKIHRILRVHNRGLRTLFDETLNQLVEEDDIANNPYASTTQPAYPVTKLDFLNYLKMTACFGYCISK